MSPAARMAVQYVLLFGATGVSLPYAGLWLKAQGLTGAEIGALLAAPMLGRLVTGPLLAVWADGFAARRTPIALLAVVAAAGYGAAALFDGFWPRLVCWFAGATAAATLIPLADVLNLRLARRWGHSFAWPRGFGSAAFVAANVLMGAILVRAPTGWIIGWVVTVSLLAAFAAWRVLPPEPVEEGGPRAGRERFAGLGRLLGDSRFLLAILAVGCVQATHAFYYGFSALIWRGQGAPESLTGLFWGFSVVVEIAFMWLVEPWRRRRGVGAVTLLLVGCGAAVVRWSIMAAQPPLWSVWGLQALHALSFAATYLASVELVERLVPRDSQTAAQTLNSVVSSGALIGLATLASGALYDRFGASGYLAMAGLAAAGGMLTLWLAARLREGVAAMG